MKRFTRYAITALIGLLVALPVWLKDGLFRAGGSTQRLLKALSNGAFLAAVLLVGVGLMVFISREGLFDAFRYTMEGILKGLLPRHRDEKRPSYADYREARGRKAAGSFLHLIIVGLVFLAVALVAALLFERGYQPPVL